MNPFAQADLLGGSSDQFRLARIQTFNWGRSRMSSTSPFRKRATSSSALLGLASRQSSMRTQRC